MILVREIEPSKFQILVMRAGKYDCDTKTAIAIMRIDTDGVSACRVRHAAKTRQEAMEILFDVWGHDDYDKLYDELRSYLM